jgi:hypothetical protein
MVTILVIGLMVSLAQVGYSAPTGTAFTYQGRLIDTNDTADGLYDLQFRLFSDPILDGSQVGPTVEVNDIDIIDGYFMTELDFGSSVFNGDARWLDIGVRPGDSNDVHTILNPRQQVTPTPYAIHANTANSSVNGVTGSGTTNRLAKFTGTKVVGDSAIYESGGKVGIGTSSPGAKLEINQNSWVDILKVGLLTSTNRLILSSGATWASISGSITNRNDIVIQHSNGNVGIGTTSPSEKLDVAGNIDVSSNQIKNYYGFPRPNYDSGWVSIDSPEIITLTHGLGGSVDNYVVDMQFKGILGTHCGGYGGDEGMSGLSEGAIYRDLGTNTIRIQRYSNDHNVDQFRIRIWVYN